MLRFGFCCLLALIAGNALAATMLEIRTDEGLTRVYKDGSHSRMESGDGYMIIDSKVETLFVVMPNERRAIDLSSTLKTPAKGSGKPVSEIVRIENNAQLPPNAFAVPAGYQVVAASPGL